VAAKKRKTKEKEHGLVPLADGPIATPDELGELRDISTPSLARIEVRHGRREFKIPARGDETEPQSVDSFNAVVIDVVMQKVMYLKEFTERGEGQMPDCTVLGKGGIPTATVSKVITYKGVQVTAFGACAECHFDQFGSGAGKSKACKDGWMMYVLLEGYSIPCRLKVPITSRKSVEAWIARLRSVRRVPRMVTTKFSATDHPTRDTVSIIQMSIVDAVPQAVYDEVIEPMYAGLHEFIRTPRSIQAEVPDEKEEAEKPASSSRKKGGRRGPKGAEI